MDEENKWTVNLKWVQRRGNIFFKAKDVIKMIKHCKDHGCEIDEIMEDFEKHEYAACLDVDGMQHLLPNGITISDV